MFLKLRRLVQLTGRETVFLWYACRDPRTPALAKVAAVAVAVYVICPIDFIPDIFPIMGWADDVALLALAVPAAARLVPAEPAYDARLAANRLLARWKFWRRDP